MSTKSLLKDLSGPRVRVRGVSRVSSGSRGKFLLQSERGSIKAPEAALALAKRHLSMREAHAIVTRLFDHGAVVVDLPVVESTTRFISDMAVCNVVAKPYGPPPKVDAKAVRDMMGRSQQ